MKKVFNFLILAYNQEQYILSTLESIKYQIINYGSDYIVNLYITDDCSKDRTFEFANNWVANNKELFNIVKVMSNAENKGTVYNYNTLLSFVKEGEYFKALAADDIFAKEDLFSKVVCAGMTQIYSYPYLQIENDIITVNKKYAYSFFYKKNSYNTNKLIKRFMRGGYFNTPSTVYSAELFNSSKCYEENKDYILFEDDPTIYAILKNNPNISVNFENTPIVLYRVSGGVSNSPNKIFLNDYIKLQEKYFKDSKGIYRLYFYIRLNGILKNKKYTFISFINKYCQIRNFIFAKLIKKNEFDKFYNYLENKAKESQLFYNEINAIN